MNALTKPYALSRRLTFPLAFLFLLFLVFPSELKAISPGTTYHFVSADNCDCSGTAYYEGTLKRTSSRCVYDQNRAEAAAALFVSAINYDVTAFDTLHTCFYVSGTKPTVLDATVSANIEWDGILYGAGVLGAGASVAIDLYLVDTTDHVIKASTRIMQEAQDSIGLKGIDVGGSPVSGSKAVSMKGTVVRGHQYTIQMKVTTFAETGLVGASIGSIFEADLGLGDHYVKWNELAITISDDINEKLDQLLQGQEELKQGQEEIKQKIDDHDADIKKLLKTPEGRRPGFPVK